VINELKTLLKERSPWRHAVIGDRSLLPTRQQDCLYRGTNLRRDVYLTFTPTFRSCSENRLPIYSETSLSPGLFMRSLSYHRLYARPRDARYSGSQVLRRWLCFLLLLLIEYQYNLPTSGADLASGLSAQRDRSFRAVFQKHQTTDPQGSLLWALAPQAQPQVSPSAHALTRFFWRSTHSLVPKELRL